MTRRLAAASFLVLSLASVARADVAPIPSFGGIGAPVVAIGLLVAGAAVSLGLVVGGVIWMRRRTPSNHDQDA